jgi:hypothetical protein
MLSIRRAFAPAVADAAQLDVVPEAGTSTPTYPYFRLPTDSQLPAMPTFAPAVPSPGAGVPSTWAGPCRTASRRQRQGATAGTAAAVCTGVGLTFIGPAT